MSFRLKILIGVSLIQLLLISLLMFVGVNYMLKTLQEQLINSAKSSVQLLSSASIDAIIASDIASLTSISEQLISNPDYVYVRILDENNTILSQSGDVDALNNKFLEDKELQHSKNDGVFDTYSNVEIDGDIYGRVEVGISSQKLIQTTSKARNTTILFTIIAVIFSSLLSYLLSRYLSRRLDQLESAAHKVSQGALGYQININSNDELGRTAASFNKMSSQIKQLYDDQIESNKILDTISRAQELFIKDIDKEVIFTQLLNDVIEITESEFGFIAEVIYQEQPFLRTVSMTDITWDERSRNQYARIKTKGLEFRDLSNLLGAALEQRAVFITNSPTTHPRYNGSIGNHPVLHSFAEVPIFLQQNIVAVIAISNRKDGYSPEIIKRIEPLNNIIANLLDALQKQAVITTTQEKLEISQERFTLLVKGTADGIWDWDIDTAEVYFSPRWYEMLGYDSEELPASFLSWQSIIHDEDLGVALDSWMACMNHDTPSFSFEYRLKTKHGLFIWVECRGAAILSSTDQIIRMVGSHTDITIRKKIELEIARNAKHSKAILDNVIDGIISIEGSGKIIDANPAITRIFNYNHDHLLQCNLSSLVSEQSYTTFIDTINNLSDELLDNNNELTLELDGIRSSGEIFPIEVSVSKVTMDSDIKMFVSVINDITDRKNAENAIKLANDAALETERTKSAFMANMSHEIRTPMHGILGMLQILNNTQLSLEQREYIKTAKNASDDLLRIIDDVLDFSKIQSGKLDIENIEFDLREMIDDVITLLTQQAQKKNLELEQFMPINTHAKLQGDPHRIRQVLINLIGNALKFTEAGSIIVHAHTIETDDVYSKIRFEITDTGIGIEASSLPYLFESFRQADTAMSRKYGGTGLGLTISKQLVELMGGNIGVQSGAGEGSTFWFEILFEKNLFEQQPVYPAIKHKSALIINPSDFIQKITADTLSAWGITYDMVNNYTDAQNAMREYADKNSTYDYILADYHSNVEGFSYFIKNKATKPFLSHTRIILIINSISDAPTFPDTDALYYLPRPVRLASLYKALTSSLTSASDSIQTFNNIRTYTGSKVQGSILLVEDNLINQEICNEMLRRIGFSVDIASDGEQALTKAKSTSYDIILMDCQMPGMDGFTATRHYREHEQTTGISPTTIIALTANNHKGDRKKCTQAGMDDYITKPFYEEELGNKLQSWMAARANAVVNKPPAGMPAAKTNNEVVAAKEHDQLAILDNNKITELKRLFGKNFNIVISKFISSSKKSIHDLKAASEENNHKRLLEINHSLKGGSANIGASALNQLCTEMEEKIMSEMGINTNDYTFRIEAAFNECKSAFSKMSRL